MPSASATTSSDLISRRFAALRERDAKALVVYITAGHPTPDDTVALMQTLEAAGADVIQVGVPFSAPMADGPVIQASSPRGLRHGEQFRPTFALLPGAAVPAPDPLSGGARVGAGVPPRSLARVMGVVEA